MIRKNLFLRSTMRRYLSFILFLLLFGVGSAAFTVRAVGYLSVSDGIENLTKRYRPIGTLTSADGDVTAGAELLEQSEYLALSDRRLGVPGAMKDYYNTDLSGNISRREGIGNSEILVWGKLTNKQHAVEISPDYRCSFMIEEVIYGYPDQVYEGRIIHAVSRLHEDGQGGDAVMTDEVYDTLQIGAAYLLRACYDPDENIGSDYGVYELKQVREGDWFFDEQEGKRQLKSLLDEEAERKEINRHSMLLIGTKDMSVMPGTQEVNRDLYLIDGRWITEEDDKYANPVCVVHGDFAAARQIEVGDRLTITLRDLENSFLGYIIEGENWQDCRKETIDFEVVGIYGRFGKNLFEDQLTWYSTYLYVPAGCIPDGFGIGADEELDSSSYSFVLSSPKEKDAFLAAYRGTLEALGFRVQFVENGWETFWNAAWPIEWGAFAGLLVFSGVVFLLLLLAAYLYLWQHRQEFAVLRAIGVPSRRAVFWCSGAVLLPGLPGFCIGGALSFRYALSQANALLAEMPEAVSGGVSPVWFFILCVGQTAALLLFTAVGASLLSVRPVLEILQGSRGKKEHKKETEKKQKLPVEENRLPYRANDSASDDLARVSAVLSQTAASEKRIGKGDASSVRFVRRCICRSVLKSFLAVFMAVVFLLALGFMHRSIERNEMEIERLYKNTIVEGDAVKANSSVSIAGTGGAFIRGRTVDAVLDTGFIGSYYIEAGMAAARVCKLDISNGSIGEILQEAAEIRGIADIQRFLEIQGSELTIHYMEGYSEELFEVDYSELSPSGFLAHISPVILPEAFLSAWEMNVGDYLVLSDSTGENMLDVMIGGYYSGTGATFGADTFLLPLSVVRMLEGDNMNYAAASFTIDPEKNRELATFRAETEEIFADPNAGLTELSFLLWDSELRQAVEPLEKNVGLLKTLYPIVMILSVLAAALTSFLLLQTHTRDAAILRVLGTTKGRTRGMLVSEQLLLAAAGTCIGTVLAAAASGEAMLTVMPVFMGLYLAGTLAGAMAGAVLATNKTPIALLQVKE